MHILWHGTRVQTATTENRKYPTYSVRFISHHVVETNIKLLIHIVNDCVSRQALVFETEFIECFKVVISFARTRAPNTEKTRSPKCLNKNDSFGRHAVPTHSWSNY